MISYETVKRIVDSVMGAFFAKHRFGKYRGVVRDNIDPQGLGRIRAEVPEVFGKGYSATQWSNWAMPCVPFAGNGRAVFFTPRVGDTVWIEFEGGNPSKPIWSGMWFQSGAVPEGVSAYAPLFSEIETLNYRVSFRDTNSETDGLYPELLIESKATGASIKFDETKAASKMILEARAWVSSTMTGEEAITPGVAKHRITLDCTTGAEKIVIEDLVHTDTKITLSSAGVKVETNSTVVIEGSSVMLGENASNEHVVLGNILQTFIGQVKTWLDGHTHGFTDAAPGTANLTTFPSLVAGGIVQDFSPTVPSPLLSTKVHVE